MYHLIIVVISIVLTAAVAAATVVYAPSGAMQRHRTLMGALNGFQSLERASALYFKANWADLALNPLSPGTDMTSVLSPGYGFIPASPGAGFDWHVAAGDYAGLQAIGICLAAGAGVSYYDEIYQSMVNRMSVGSMTRGNACNASGYDSHGTHLTYWVVLDHWVE